MILWLFDPLYSSIQLPSTDELPQRHMLMLSSLVPSTPSARIFTCTTRGLERVERDAWPKNVEKPKAFPTNHGTFIMIHHVGSWLVDVQTVQECLVHGW